MHFCHVKNATGCSMCAISKREKALKRRKLRAFCKRICDFNSTSEFSMGKTAWLSGWGPPFFGSLRLQGVKVTYVELKSDGSEGVPTVKWFMKFRNHKLHSKWIHTAHVLAWKYKVTVSRYTVHSALFLIQNKIPEPKLFLLITMT